MKKFLFVAGMVVYMTVLGMETAYAQQVRLDDAIQNAAAELSAAIVRGSRVAVLSMEAGSVSMSDYLIDEMIVAFIRAGGFTVVDRAQLDLVAQELHFQMSGEVDDATAQSIGRFMGVQSIVTGAFEPLGDFYRFIVRLIEVETAAIRGIHTANVQNDTIIAALLGSGGRGQGSGRAPRAPREPRAPRVAGYQYRINWMSGELSGLGVGVRFERDMTDVFSVGGVAWINYNPMTDTDSFGAVAAGRFFPGGSPFYLELGLGFGMVAYWWEEEHFDGWGGWFWQDEWREVWGIKIVPAIGVRLGGQTRAFFASPFISLPIVIGDGVAVDFRLGVGLGGAW